MKAKITYCYPRIVARALTGPVMRDCKVGEIVDVICRNNNTEIYFSDLSNVKIFGDAFKDKGPIQLEVL